MFEQPDKRNFTLEDYEKLSQFEKDILLNIKVSDRGYIHRVGLEKTLRNTIGYKDMVVEEIEKALITLELEGWLINYREDYCKIDNSTVHQVINDYDRGYRSWGFES